MNRSLHIKGETPGRAIWQGAFKNPHGSSRREEAHLSFDEEIRASLRRLLRNFESALAIWPVNGIPVLLVLAVLLTAGNFAMADETNSTSRVDYKSFGIITERNIFDPTRRQGRIRSNEPGPRNQRMESFTLVGTMTSAQGQFAFFNSSSSQFRKAVKPGETIAGYKVAEIEHDQVKLAATSNQTISLPLLTQMRRQEGGPWSIGPRGEGVEAPAPEGAAPASTESKPAEPSEKSDVMSDVMKRLMEKRAKE